MSISFLSKHYIFQRCDEGVKGEKFCAKHVKFLHAHHIDMHVDPNGELELELERVMQLVEKLLV